MEGQGIVDWGCFIHIIGLFPKPESQYVPFIVLIVR